MSAKKSVKVNAIVVGKWIKGLFLKKPMLSLKLENMEPQYYDLETGMAFWNACEKGDKISFTMYQHADGLYYSFPE